MKTLGGIYRDSEPTDIPENRYYSALNAILTEKKGALENEPGFTQFGLNTTGTIIGIRPLENGDTVIFVSANPDIIILVDSTGTGTVVADSNDFSDSLGFSTDNLIQSEFYVNAADQRIVAFIEDGNVPRIINIEQTIADVAAGSTPIDLKTLDLFPTAAFAALDLELLPGGGSLTSGSYSIIYRYKARIGGFSDWSVPSRVIPVSNNNSPFEGSAGGNLSGYGIRINLGTVSIDSVDEAYESIEWAYIKSEDNIISARKFATTTISGGSTSLILASEQNTEDLLIEEILTVSPLYNRAKAITQLNNSLFLGNLTTDDDRLANFQADVVNNITLDFTITQVDPTTVDREDLSDRTTFMPGEVYAFYIQVQIDGKWSRAFTIPGPALAGNGNDNVAYASPGDVTGGTVSSGTYKRFQIEDTATLIGAAATGELGGYENMDENYPNDTRYGTLAGQPVRHHKFPSIGLIQNRYGASSVGDIFILGVNIENMDLSLGDDYTGLITGIRLLHAERNFQNATTLGQSMVFVGGQRESTADQKYPSCGGFDIVAATGSAALSGIDKDLDHIRWHGFDVLRSKPSVNINNLRLDVFYDDIDRVRLNTNSTTSGDVRAERINAEDASTTTNRGPVIVAGTIPNDMIAVDVKEYIPNGISKTLSLAGNDVTYNNVAGEEHLLLEPESPLPASSEIGGDINSIGNNASPPGEYHMYLATALNLQRNVYANFDNQSLRPVTEYFTLDGLGTFGGGVLSNLDTTEYGGDSFVGPYGVLCTAPISTDIANFPDGIRNAGGNILGEGCRALFTVPVCYSNLNINMRYSETDQGYYWPKFDPVAGPETEWVQDPMSIFDINQNLEFLYNDDHTLTILEQVTSFAIDNPNLIIDTSFPNLIIRSQDQPRQELTANWQNFLINDVFTIEREKGPITNLQGASNSRLYIHTSNSLYFTKNRTVLAASAEDVTLGAGDIFAIPPVEVVPSGDTGYAGTTEPLACIMTKLGYVFPNIKEGKIFIHSGEALEEISNNGMRTFFKSQFEPENLDKIRIGYDEEYNRLLISYQGRQRRSNLELNWTISYSPEIKGFVSFHDYNPEFYFTHPDLGLFSSIFTGPGLGFSSMYRHNDLLNGSFGVYYDSGTTNPFEFTAVYNKFGYAKKYFNSLEWTTEARTNALKGAGSNTEVTVSQDTFNSITVTSATKSTGEITLVPLTASNQIYNANIRNVENTWKFNRLRNALDSAIEVTRETDVVNRETNIQSGLVSLPWYRKSRFVEAYILVNYSYLNADDNKFYLLDHDVEIRKSFR